MEILSHLEQNVHHFKLLIGEKIYYYKEYLDDRGKLIDSELHDDMGFPVKDENLINEISEKISY